MTGPKAGVVIGADGRVDPASLARVQAAIQGQNQPGGLPLGSYRPNPDGTLTILTSKDPRVPPGSVLNKDGMFQNPDGTPVVGGTGDPIWAVRQSDGQPAAKNPNFNGDNPLYNKNGTGLIQTVPGVKPAAAAIDSGIDAGKQLIDKIGAGIDGMGGSSGPTPDADPGGDVRARQLAYADQLDATINGTAGPSAADIQGHNAQDRAIAQQFAAAQGATGANTSMAYRQALQNAAGISQQGAADAATLRAKEVSDAQGQLGTALGTTRGGDLTKYGTDVGAGNTRYAADKDFEGKAIGAAAGAGSGIVQSLISDKDKKTAIGSGDDEIAAMLDGLKAQKFKYKNPGEPGAAPGKRAGVMAQDLEKSMAGRALVIDTPGGKAIDSPQAIGAMLAALASLHARTKRLEGRG